MPETADTLETPGPRPLLLGFVAADQAASAEDIEGLRWAETTIDDVTAVTVNDIDPEDTLDVLSDAQERLIRLARHATVVPVRPGTLAPSGPVTEGAERAASDLDRYAGCIEMRLRGEYNEERLIELIYPDIPRQPTSSGESEIELGRRVARRIEKQREIDSGPIVEAVSGIVADYKTSEVSDLRACDLNLCVERASVPALEEELKALVASGLNHVSFRLIGPLPLYSFV